LQITDAIPLPNGVTVLTFRPVDQILDEALPNN
jgi:hypothetical protein